MATTRFTIYDESDNSVSFDHEEATDGGTTKGRYSIDIASDLTAGGDIKMQIRPGKRYKENFSMIVSESKYLSFVNLITNGSENYYIEYASVPPPLANDDEILVTNFFEIAITLGDVEMNSGAGELFYHFPLGISMTGLL